ncbi:MAG: flagellar protein export ATPase FliI [Holosporales bacterium]
MMLGGLQAEIERLFTAVPYGYVQSIVGNVVSVTGIERHAVIGGSCILYPQSRAPISAEVVGLKDATVLVMVFEDLQGVGAGTRVEYVAHESVIFPSDQWLGRVINGMGQPMDSLGPIQFGPQAYKILNSPLPASKRGLVQQRLDVGVRAMNCFTTCCRGQRMGIFAGSGVGKSVMLSQIARFTEADVIVIGLIGERGREVREFLELYLGPEGLKRAVVVVATSDESALMRRRAAYLTLSVAEYFRDQGQEVLCLMDSVTRFAMAMREIGLAVGEPPTTKGYTPTVFAELPRLLERAGPGDAELGGNITGLFTVLVDGDDHNEPVADAVRGILDGHVVLERAIAERGRYPAINILRSISRTMPDCHNPNEQALVARAKRLLATYEDMADMIRLGAYRKGSSAEVDEAIRYQPALEAFLGQGKHESESLEGSFSKLQQVLMQTAKPEAA